MPSASKLPARSKTYLLFDAVLWVVAVSAAGTLRFEFQVPQSSLAPVLLFGLILAFIGSVIGAVTGLYRGRFREGSFDELLGVSYTAVATALISTIFLAASAPQLGIPRSIALIASPIFILFSGGARSISRLILRGRLKSTSAGGPALIYGAGAMAELLLKELASRQHSEFRPVALIDDDPQKQNRTISGIRTIGSFAGLKSHVVRTGAKALIVAIPRADSDFLQRVRDSCDALGLEVLVLPSFPEILATRDGPVALQKLKIEDLIGRRAVTIDTAAIRSLISGATVVITGAGGSIGTELSRQVQQYSPGRLVLLDRDETGLQQAQLATTKSGLLEGENFALIDIRDGDALTQMFAKIQPTVVFHAAALKHLPALERFPTEAWKTNVLGTLNVLEAAFAAGAQHFVNISTDKAAEPTSALGRSKQIAEQLTAWFSEREQGSYISVRFGNVLGSRGSLIPTIQSQIDMGGPVSVTDPQATRYFMTTQEACQLVLQAGTEQSDRSVFILNMGKPVKILGIVQKMIAMAGRQVEINFSGLRAGEKLHEKLNTELEEVSESSHPLIWRVQTTTVSPSRVLRYASQFKPE